jgi:hypothetical protein
MRILMSRTEKSAAVLILALLFSWNQRADIYDFFRGILSGYEKNKEWHVRG